MPTYRVLDANGVFVHQYRHDTQIDYSGNWPGCTQELVPEPDPEAPPGYSGSWQITKLAFRSRFTQAEKVAIEIAGVDRPNGSPSERANAAALRVHQADVAVATFIDLTRDDTRAGVQSLETAGLIAAGRAAVILDTPPTESEVWNG